MYMYSTDYCSVICYVMGDGASSGRQAASGPAVKRSAFVAFVGGGPEQFIRLAVIATERIPSHLSEFQLMIRLTYPGGPSKMRPGQQGSGYCVIWPISFFFFKSIPWGRERRRGKKKKDTATFQAKPSDE